jgi:hypothetical protein
VSNKCCSPVLADVEHYLERLHDTLKNLTILDDTIQDVLEDEDYEADVESCERYIENSKRAIQKAKGLIKHKTEETSGAHTTSVK